jgi:hypothetical protein
MHLVQILLPLSGNDGEPLLHSTYDRIREELVGKFGGLTAFTQSPAEGIWIPEDKQAQRDEVIMIEVMTEDLDVSWWTVYRKTLEKRLKQESVVIRSLAMQAL